MWTAKPKLIYVSRDAKDVAISFYHFYKDLYRSPISFEKFLDAFLEDRVQFAPYREHVNDYAKIKNYDNILLLSFENLIMKFDETIHKLCKFLGKSITNENMEKLKQHVKFESMKGKNFLHNN